MRPRHAAVISLILALAVGAGAYAAQRTTAAAASAQATAGAKDVAKQVARRTRALDRMEASLRRALRQRPPALPRLPRYKAIHLAPRTTAAPSAAVAQPAPPPAAPAAPPAPPVQRVITVRPPPVIVTVHRHGGEHDDRAEGAPAARSQSTHPSGGLDD
jgi:hypothetical protein